MTRSGKWSPDEWDLGPYKRDPTKLPNPFLPHVWLQLEGASYEDAGPSHIKLCGVCDKSYRKKDEWLMGEQRLVTALPLKSQVCLFRNSTVLFMQEQSILMSPQLTKDN